MSFLSSLLKSAAYPSGSGTAVIPYVRLQKYFQLFVGGIYTVKENPALNDPSINVPGQIFRHFGREEGDDFFSDESSFTATGQFSNPNGGHIYHGEYTTHGKDGGAVEYLYIVITSSESTDDAKQKKFVPHFIFLGGRMPGDLEEIVYSLFMMSRSGYDGKNALLTDVNQSNTLDVVSALAHADIPMKLILANESVDADQIAADFADMPIPVRSQKFNFLAVNRTPNFLSLEMIR